MKYIRTNSGDIIDLDYLKSKYKLLEDKNKYYIEPITMHSLMIFKEFIVKQTDTIEELCDEYVVEDNYYSAIFNNLKLARQTKGTCYGAIRTEWGLKYVAKINKEGKWELL